MGGHKYTASCLQSKIKAPYGYYEVRCGIAREMPTNIHYIPDGVGNGNHQSDPKKINTDVRPADDVHTFGIKWKKNLSRWDFLDTPARRSRRTT